MADNSDNSNNSTNGSNNDNSTHMADNADRSMNNSNNTDSSTNTYTLSMQELGGSVTGTQVMFSQSDNRGVGVTTGSIGYSGSSFQNFAGVQTASLNTGVGSINQAATSLAANANISFGN